MIPPALPKVGEPVAEGDLADFKADGTGPRDIPIAHDHHFAPPPEEVSDEVYIKDGIRKVCDRRRWVLWCEETAIIAIAAFRQFFAKVVIEHAESLACLVHWQQ